jgi:hypothetical protein
MAKRKSWFAIRTEEDMDRGLSPDEEPDLLVFRAEVINGQTYWRILSEQERIKEWRKRHEQT